MSAPVTSARLKAIATFAETVEELVGRVGYGDAHTHVRDLRRLLQSVALDAELDEADALERKLRSQERAAWAAKYRFRRRYRRARARLTCLGCCLPVLGWPGGDMHSECIEWRPRRRAAA